MAIVTTDDKHYHDIADAIRSKIDVGVLKPEEMATAIESIKVEETIEIPFTITVSSILVESEEGGGGGGGGGSGATYMRSIGQITFDGDEVFDWYISGQSTTTYVSAFWNDRLMTDFYNVTDGIITSKQQDGISNIFSTGFDEGFEVGVYNSFDSIYIYDVPSIVSSGSVTLTNVNDQPNNEITVTGVFIG